MLCTLLKFVLGFGCKHYVLGYGVIPCISVYPRWCVIKLDDLEMADEFINVSYVNESLSKCIEVGKYLEVSNYEFT